MSKYVLFKFNFIERLRESVLIKQILSGSEDVKDIINSATFSNTFISQWWTTRFLVLLNSLFYWKVIKRIAQPKAYTHILVLDQTIFHGLNKKATPWNTFQNKWTFIEIIISEVISDDMRWRHWSITISSPHCLSAHIWASNYNWSEQNSVFCDTLYWDIYLSDKIKFILKGIHKSYYIILKNQYHVFREITSQIL